MRTPELETPKSQFELLSAEIDDAVAAGPKPIHLDLEAYEQVVQMGEAALPELLATSWNMNVWRMQAIIAIADDLERPIGLPPREASYYKLLYIVIRWGEQNGYISGQLPAEKPQ